MPSTRPEAKKSPLRLKRKHVECPLPKDACGIRYFLRLSKSERGGPIRRTYVDAPKEILDNLARGQRDPPVRDSLLEGT